MATRIQLEFTPEVEAQTQAAYSKLKDTVPSFEWPTMAPLIAYINKLKKEKNAVILAHNYMTPDIFHGVADIVGDSLALAEKAKDVDADVIVMCGVHFMAETAKIVNPQKTVLIPDMKAGCSLADSITAEDIRLLKQKYPGVPVVTYVNTTAEVKAETDVCCTSSNAVEVVESLNVPEVLFLPDQYLAKWVAGQTKTKIISWAGQCEVHERFTGHEIKEYRNRFAETEDKLMVIAHPECPPDVTAEADFVGSTSAMINYAKDNKPKRVLMVTECSMSDNVAAELPEVEFIRPCNLCPHMKRITLDNIASCLENLSGEVTVDPAIAAKAERAVENMLKVKDKLAMRRIGSSISSQKPLKTAS